MKALDDSISSSPDLPHKIPARLRTKQDDVIDEELDDCREKTNLYGVKFVMWFEVGIERRRIGEVQSSLDLRTKNFPRKWRTIFCLSGTVAHCDTHVQVG